LNIFQGLNVQNKNQLLIIKLIKLYRLQFLSIKISATIPK